MDDNVRFTEDELRIIEKCSFIADPDKNGFPELAARLLTKMVDAEMKEDFDSLHRYMASLRKNYEQFSSRQ